MLAYARDYMIKQGFSYVLPPLHVSRQRKVWRCYEF
jgi:hypothetical protein